MQVPASVFYHGIWQTKSTLERIFCDKYTKMKTDTFQGIRLSQPFHTHFSTAGILGSQNCPFLQAITAPISSWWVEVFGTSCYSGGIRQIISVERNNLHSTKISHRCFDPFSVVLKNGSWYWWMVEGADGGSMLWWETENLTHGWEFPCTRTARFCHKWTFLWKEHKMQFHSHPG